MTVEELIEILEDMDPDAEVLLVHQRQWPFECSLAGVTTREEVVGPDGEEDPGRDLAWNSPPRRGSDIFLLEGEQLRYGNAAAWDVAGY